VEIFIVRIEGWENMNSDRVFFLFSTVSELIGWNRCVNCTAKTENEAEGDEQRIPMGGQMHGDWFNKLLIILGLAI